MQLALRIELKFDFLEEFKVGIGVYLIYIFYFVQL